MKLDIKGLLGIIFVCGVLIIAAYQMGLSQGEKTQALSKKNTSPSNEKNAPSNTEAVTQNSSEIGSDVPAPAKFSHFRVGNRNVKGMLADGEYVWVGTSGGVIRYELKTDKYKLFDVSTGSLLSNGVFHVSKLDDKIAIGTYGGGLSLYDEKNDNWKNYNIPDGLADQFVYDLQRVSNGDIWIATWSGANRIRNGELDKPENWETFNVENTNGGLPNDWVYGLEEGKNGELWFATEKGLARYAKGVWENWQHESGLGADYETVKDDIKFSRDPGNASRHHAQQKQDQGLSDVNVAYNPNYIVSLEVDEDGIVWCGTWGAGLARFDGKNWKNITTRDGLPSNHVFMLYKDLSGHIWAGTSEGLARIKGTKPDKIIKRAQGLFADNVFSMANAADGSIWVGSFGGVARLSGQF